MLDEVFRMVIGGPSKLRMKCIDAKIVSYMQFVLLEMTSKSNWYFIYVYGSQQQNSLASL